MRTIKDLDSLSEKSKQNENCDVNNMTQQILKKDKNRMNTNKRYLIVGKVLAASLMVVIFIYLSMNKDPIPIINSGVRVTKSKEYEHIGNGYEVRIGSLQIEGTGNNKLFVKLNTKYDEKSKELYNEFLSRIDEGIGNIHLSSVYNIKADNGVTMTVEHCVSETLASGYKKYEYDTFDVKNEKYITLPSLFKDESYLEIISNEIIKQVRDEMKNNEDKIYFLDETGFTGINEDRQFYIDNNNKLVIVFDEYEISPGYMGSPEFVIPTHLIESILVEDYVK